MALKTFRPMTPSLRQLVQVDRSQLWKGGPVKMLTEGKPKTGGRNSDGRITTRHIGGGHKQAYRLVDFRRRKHDVAATVERLEYEDGEYELNFPMTVGPRFIGGDALSFRQGEGTSPDTTTVTDACLPKWRRMYSFCRSFWASSRT